MEGTWNNYRALDKSCLVDNFSIANEKHGGFKKWKILLPLSISILPTISLVSCNNYETIEISDWQTLQHSLSSSPIDIAKTQTFNFTIDMDKWPAELKDYTKYRYLLLYVDDGSGICPFSLKERGFKMALDGNYLTSKQWSYENGQFGFENEEVKQSIFASKKITGKFTVINNKTKVNTKLTFYFWGQLKSIL